MSDRADTPKDRFNVTQKVRKLHGYAFDGTVRSSFRTGAGQLRYVVELDTANGDPSGLLHIFGHDQLGRRP